MKSFFYNKYFLIVFSLMIFGSLQAMEDEQLVQHEIHTSYKEELLEGTFKQTINNAKEKISDTVVGVTDKLKSWFDFKNDSVTISNELNVETSGEELTDTLLIGGSEAIIETKADVFGSNQLLLVGGTVLSVALLSGVTYLLHKKGILARVEKIIKAYPLISTATVSTLFGMIFAYVVTTH